MALTPGARIGPYEIISQIGAGAAWSFDSRRLAGAVRTSTGASVGLAIYDIAARATNLVGDYPVGGVSWLGQDTYRVVVNSGPDLWLVDVDTRQRKPLIKDIGFGSGVAVSRDGRTIYASVSHQQSDVWVVDLKGEVT